MCVFLFFPVGFSFCPPGTDRYDDAERGGWLEPQVKLDKARDDNLRVTIPAGVVNVLS